MEPVISYRVYCWLLWVGGVSSIVVDCWLISFNSVDSGFDYLVSSHWIIYYNSQIDSSTWLIGWFEKWNGHTIVASCVVTVGLLTQHCFMVWLGVCLFVLWIGLCVLYNMVLVEMMVVVNVCFDFQSGLLQLKILMIVFWLSTLYVWWISCIVSLIAPLEMGMGSITVWFYLKFDY